MDEGYQLKRPCKNCPFAPTEGRIVFSCRERAEEISESAYRTGFPCHLSAQHIEDDEGGGGFVFGAKTQHCVGALMMFIAEGSNESGWPGIYNDEELVERIQEHVDWTAPHYESEKDFLDANTEPRGVA